MSLRSNDKIMGKNELPISKDIRTINVYIDMNDCNLFKRTYTNITYL